MWKTFDELPDPLVLQEGGYFWLWDDAFEEANIYFLNHETWFGIDPDFTHWMYDGESPEPPEGP